MPRENDPIELAARKYPALLWTARYGGWLGWVLASLPLIAAIALAIEWHQAWWFLPGVAMAAGIALLARLILELLRLLVETLIPQ